MASAARAARTPARRAPSHKLPVGFGSGLAAAAVAVLTACGGNPPPPAEPTRQPVPTAPVAASQELAARAAAAKDRRYTAEYRVTGANQAPRTVTVTIAADGTWRVDVPGGALGGTKAVAIVAVRAGMYQCLLGTPASCVKVAPPHGAVPAAADPRFHQLFTRWLDVFVDRDAALSVARVANPDGMSGACYSVEPTAVSLAPPVDPGTYCFAADGTVTGARFGNASVVPSGPAVPPPPTVSLPGPVVPGPAASTAAPPPASSASPSAATPAND